MELISKNYKKSIFLFGFLFFSVLLYISWTFFKERVLAFDPSFFSFLMIDQKDFSIALGRWGSVFSQILPLLALKSHCSLITFLRLFSIAPIINYFIIFLVITLGLKNYRAAVVLMLSLCLAFRHAFYYTTAELYLGIALSVLIWALIAPENGYSSKRNKNIATIATLLLVYVCSYLHQLTLFTIVFVIAAEMLGSKRLKDKQLWLLLGITVVWYLIRIYLLTSSDYEKEKMPSAAVFIEQIPNLRYLPSTIYFKHFAFKQMWPLFLAFCIGWIYLLKIKNWLYFIFLPVYSIGFLILILITYYKGESPLMYENYYTLFGLFAGLPLVYVLFENFTLSRSIIISAIFIAVSTIGIYKAHAILTKRVEYLDRLVSYGKTRPGKKFMISTRNFPWQVGWVHWAVPFETALYSALEGPDNARTFFVAEDMNEYNDLINKENIFLGPSWAVTWFGSDKLNPDYFHFPSTGYEKLSTEQTDTTFHEQEFNKNNILINPVKDIYYSDPDSFVVVPIKITNLLGKKLCSTAAGEHPTYLSYHVYDQDRKLIRADGKRTPLEVDILNEYVQGLEVILPEKKGDYTIVVDLVTENVRWWEINSKFVLVVR
jgi:hypothetical protein